MRVTHDTQRYSIRTLFLMPLIKLCLVASLLAVVPLSAVCGRVQQHQTDIHESSDNLISQTGQIHNEQSDAIDSVPGFDGDLPSKHYAGYIPVGTSGKRCEFVLTCARVLLYVHADLGFVSVHHVAPAV